LVAIGIAVAVGAFFVGRISSDAGTARTHGYHQGHEDGYLAGLDAGTAQGRQEGRAEQVPVGSARDAFDAGYTAGANDVFSGYDGGWQTGAPYVVTLAPGTGQITYRIAGRDELEPGVAYYLCPDGHSLCRQPR
jgi:hypothetical protein